MILKQKKVGSVTDVFENDELPNKYALDQNYPNPFNPSTIIQYALPKSSHVTLKIYNMLGQEVKTLLNVNQNAGAKQVQWNGDNNYGSKVASGIYIYMIKADNFYQAKKMILMK